MDPWKNVPEQGVLGFFHGSAGGWAGGGPTDPSGSMEQNEADVHRLDHILRGEVGISCNSMLLGTQTCWSQGEAIRTTATDSNLFTVFDRLSSL